MGRGAWRFPQPCPPKASSLARCVAAVLSAPLELALFGLRRRVPVVSQRWSPQLAVITVLPGTQLGAVSFWAVFQKHSEFPFYPSQAAGSTRLATPGGCWLSGQRATWLPPSLSWPFLREPQGLTVQRKSVCVWKGGGGGVGGNLSGQGCRAGATSQEGPASDFREVPFTAQPFAG